MAFFQKKKRVIDVGGRKIELEPKPAGFSLFKKKPGTPAPQPAKAPHMTHAAPAAPEKRVERKLAFPGFSFGKKPVTAPMRGPTAPISQPSTGGAASTPPGTPRLIVPKVEQEKAEPVMGQYAGPGMPQRLSNSPIDRFLKKTLAKQKGLALALREQGVRGTPEQFVKRMFTAAVMMSVIVGLVAGVFLVSAGLALIEVILLAVVIAIAMFQFIFNMFLQYPNRRRGESAKIIERDILFAARDMIISLRSGMPLFDAIKAVSSGYGDASKEFAKIVEKAQFRVPLEEAIDSTLSESKSPSFKKIMLQATVSIKAGADVVSALQAVIDQLSQERIIELRAYGQRLNALAMFYMLFGIILPSMGIAVLTILTTFIALFTVNVTLLAMVLVFILFIQIVFLKLIASSRPVFAM